MRITDSATSAILNVMKSKGLDVTTTFLEIGVYDGNLGMSFTRNPIGTTMKNGELSIVISSKVNTTGIVIDYGQVGEKTGLIFLGEQNVN
jgi:hypothetical protein